MCVCVCVCVYTHTHTYISSVFNSFLNYPVFLATSFCFARICTAFHYLTCRSFRFVGYCVQNSPTQDPVSSSSISAISQTSTLISKQNFSLCFSDPSTKCMLLLLLDSSLLSLLTFQAQCLLYIHKSVLFCYTGCLFVPYDFHNKSPLFPCTALTVWSL